MPQKTLKFINKDLIYAASNKVKFTCLTYKKISGLQKARIYNSQWGGETQAIRGKLIQKWYTNNVRSQDTKTIIITVVHMFEKEEERLNMLSRDIWKTVCVYMGICMWNATLKF